MKRYVIERGSRETLALTAESELNATSIVTRAEVAAAFARAARSGLLTQARARSAQRSFAGDWPDLVRSIRDSARSRQGHDKWIAFTSDITWDILKTDGIAAHGSEIGIIQALDSSDADQESRTSAIVISAGDSDGKVTACVSLSKFPPV